MSFKWGPTNFRDQIYWPRGGARTCHASTRLRERVKSEGGEAHVARVVVASWWQRCKSAFLKFKINLIFLVKNCHFLARWYRRWQNWRICTKLLLLSSDTFENLWSRIYVIIFSNAIFILKYFRFQTKSVRLGCQNISQISFLFYFLTIIIE